MSPLITLAVLLALGLFMAVFYVIAHKFEEFEEAFLMLTWVGVVLVVGAAVYLAYATPTFAEHTAKVGTTVVTEDTSNLLQE